MFSYKTITIIVCRGFALLLIIHKFISCCNITVIWPTKLLTLEFRIVLICICPVFLDKVQDVTLDISLYIIFVCLKILCRVSTNLLMFLTEITFKNVQWLLVSMCKSLCENILVQVISRKIHTHSTLVNGVVMWTCCSILIDFD